MVVSAALQIGITGGIGSGKSLICRIFKCLGVPVYDADSRAKYLMTTDGILVEDIRKEFGNLSYDKDGALNRKHLSDATFRDPARLAKLNSLVHPRVAVDFSNWVAAQRFPYIIKEAALLYEAGSYKTLNKVIVVTAPENIRIQRVMTRDPQRTEKMVRDIIKNQMPESEIAEKADFRVVNDGSRLVIPQVLELHQRFVA
jgi:dephospho-CoA kinase